MDSLCCIPRCLAKEKPEFQDSKTWANGEKNMVGRSISCCTTVELHQTSPHLCTATDFPRHLEAPSDSRGGHMSHGMIKSSGHTQHPAATSLASLALNA